MIHLKNIKFQKTHLRLVSWANLLKQYLQRGRIDRLRRGPFGAVATSFYLFSLTRKGPCHRFG